MFQVPGREKRRHWAWWVHKKQVFILHLDTWYLFEKQNISKTYQNIPGRIFKRPFSFTFGRSNFLRLAGYLGRILSDHLSPTHSELDEAFSRLGLESSFYLAAQRLKTSQRKDQYRHQHTTLLVRFLDAENDAALLWGLYPSCASFGSSNSTGWNHRIFWGTWLAYLAQLFRHYDIQPWKSLRISDRWWRPNIRRTIERTYKTIKPYRYWEKLPPSTADLSGFKTTWCG